MTSFDKSSTGHVATIDLSNRLFIDGQFYSNDKQQGRQLFKLARWSPDGQWLAYIVEMPNAESGALPATETVDDGVWLLQISDPNHARHVFQNYYTVNSNEYRVADTLDWSPGSDALMIGVRAFGGRRTIVIGLHADSHELPTVGQYVQGSWQPGGRQIVAMAANGTTMGVFDTAGKLITSIADGAALHLWIQYPTQLSSGQYAFLAKPSNNGLPGGDQSGLSLYLYSPGGIAVKVSTQALPGVVVAGEWSPAHSGLLVQVRTTQGIQPYLLTFDGSVIPYPLQASAGTHWQR